MKVGSCLITSDRTAAYTGMSSALVSHWRTLTISVSCAPAAASASATLRQACLASSAKSSGSVPSGRSPQGLTWAEAVEGRMER